MNDLPRQQYLLLKARCKGRVRGDFRPNNLERDASILQKLVTRLVDLTHSATSYKPNNREAAGNLGPDQWSLAG